MSLWKKVRRALRREVKDVEHAVDDALARGNAALDEKERELSATPEERLEIQQRRTSESDAEFDAIRKKIERDKT